MGQADDKPRKFGAVTPWLVLLAFSLLINYIDRGNLSLAAPFLKDELRLSPWQLGILFSAFFWTYTALQFGMGWVVDRFEVNHVIALGFLIWSLATAATGLVQGFAMLLLMRLMLGVGEAVAFPSCSKILALHVAEPDIAHRKHAGQAGLQHLGSACKRPCKGRIGPLGLIQVMPGEDEALVVQGKAAPQPLRSR